MVWFGLVWFGLVCLQRRMMQNVVQCPRRDTLFLLFRLCHTRHLCCPVYASIILSFSFLRSFSFVGLLIILSFSFLHYFSFVGSVINIRFILLLKVVAITRTITINPLYTISNGRLVYLNDLQQSGVEILADVVDVSSQVRVVV